jgi:hypothetical protein
LDPLGVFNTARDVWKGKRRLRITQADWGWEVRGDREWPVIYVRVVNAGYRTLKVDSAGTNHPSPAGAKIAAAIEGLPLALDDGHDGEFIIFPLEFESSPPTGIWIGLTTGQTFSAPLPPQPQPSTGENSNSDY